VTQAISPGPYLAPERGGAIVEERITEKLAAFCASSSAGNLPSAAMNAAHRLALDFCGVALRGSIEPSSRVAAEAVRRLAAPDSDGSTMIGYDGRTSPQYAAMLNGVSLHGLELDDTHPRGGIHLGGAILPAAFAMGERVAASGAEVLAAAVLGYEVSARLAMALPLAAHAGHGFHSTGTCNVFGAAAVCAKLLRLDVEQTMNAFGIAGSQTAGSLEYRTEGAWTKRLHPGWAAHCGVVAAELARAGFIGPHRIIEGKAGFLRSYSDVPRASLVLEGLDSDYQVLRTAIKPHAACRHSQAAIDALSELTRTHALAPSEIERITVQIFQAALTTIAEPEARKRRPKTMIDAQFNIFFASAAAILWGGPTVAHYGPETLSSPELLSLMDRVVCVPDPELSDLFPDLWPAKVEVLLRDGRRLAARIDYPLGDPENPLSWEQLVKKFRDLTEGVVSPGRQREILHAMEAFADHPVERFTRLLAREN
jgi:2-methylcitrate dehydratase PrpD